MWKDMLIIVTEDDSQSGRDHVEAHRSLLILIGPHVKKGYVSHTLANFGSIMKMIFILLDLPYLNHFDATASLPRDAFTDRPDLSRIAFGPSTSGCSIPIERSNRSIAASIGRPSWNRRASTTRTTCASYTPRRCP